MAKDLYENNATAREMFEKANEILGFRITDIMFNGTADDPARTMLGFDQEAWLTEHLAAAKERGAAWRVLGQQVMFAPLNLAPLPDLPALNLLRLPSEGLALNPDQWDGYNANRQRLLDVLQHILKLVRLCRQLSGRLDLALEQIILVASAKQLCTHLVLKILPSV